MCKNFTFLILCSSLWMIAVAQKKQEYYFYSEPLTLNEAENWCRISGIAKFVYISNELENIFIASKDIDNFESNNITDFWIGGYKYNKTNKWTWSYADFKIKYYSWDIGEPNKNGDCIASSITYGKWSAQDCNKKKPFVCEYAAKVSPAFISKCPRGWTYFEATSSCIGLTYTGQKEMVIGDWNEAEAHCNKFGGRLPSIHSMEEFEIIQNYIIFAQKPIWLGLKFENEWKWSDGSVVNYLPWHFQKGFPVQTATAKCGRAELTFITNQDCNSPAAIICKKPAAESSLIG